VPWFAISPDGETLAIVQTTDRRPPSAWESDVYQPRATIRLIDTATFDTVGAIPYDRYGPGYWLNLAFSPDGERLAVASQLGYLQLWDVPSAEPAASPFRGPDTEGLRYWTVPAFSPDGSVLATATIETGSTGGVFLWNVATGHLLERIPQKYPPTSLNFSPDGSLLVISTWNGGDSIVWDVAQRRIVRTISVDDTGIWWADLSHDGTTLLTSGDSGRESVWDLSTGEQIGPALPGPRGTVDISSDGRTFVAAGTGQVMMWDAASEVILGGTFPGPRSDDSLAAAFSPVDHTLFIVSATGQAWAWDVDRSSWDDRACRVAGRSLTEAEWQANLPDRPYDPACGA
jgi:WD40 repeat protein